MLSALLSLPYACGSEIRQSEIVCRNPHQLSVEPPLELLPESLELELLESL
jgi:hypothetical protein